MGLYRRGPIWWYRFTIAGKKVVESSHSSRRTIAAEAERNRRLQLERVLAGLPSEEPARRIQSVRDVTGPYLEKYKIGHGPHSVMGCKAIIKTLNKHLGHVLLPDLTEEKVVEYMGRRLKEGAAGRTVNSELGELSRALGRKWSALWPRVKRLKENRDVGVALTGEQEHSLIEAAERLAAGQAVKTVKRYGKAHQQRVGPRAVMMPTLIRLALLSGLRAEELTSLRWRQIDFEQRTITVGKANTAAGQGRMIPLDTEAWFALEAHLSWWVRKFGPVQPNLCVFPWGSPQPSDPTRSITTLKSAWDTVRKEAGITCRWHDLRHTFCSKLAEKGVSEGTLLSLMGHTSRAMLERYSHVRLTAKREAVRGLSTGAIVVGRNEQARMSPQAQSADTEADAEVHLV